MTLPQLKVEASFQTNPRLTPVWTDITAYCSKVGVRRGRQHELDRFEAGEASIIVDNSDHRFYPLNTGSPYYPHVVPTTRIRISGVIGGVTYPCFSGYVEAWPQEKKGWDNRFGEVTLVDAFKILALDKLSQSFVAQMSDVRVNAILDAITWTTGGSWVLGDTTYGVLGTTTIVGPVSDRYITSGRSQMQAVTLDKTPALEHLQTVQESENGLMFIGRDGEFIFRGRHSSLMSPFNTVQMYIGDNPDAMTLPREWPYVEESLKLRYDDINLWNDIVVTRTGGADSQAGDAVSQLAHWPRTKTREIAVTDLNEPLDCAYWMLASYKDPKMRVESVAMDGEYEPLTLWPLILQRELGDRINLKLHHISTPLDQDCFIEAVEMDVECTEDPIWDVRWTLSPADQTTYWILDDPVASELGVTTRLAY